MEQGHHPWSRDRSAWDDSIPQLLFPFHTATDANCTPTCTQWFEIHYFKYHSAEVEELWVKNMRQRLAIRELVDNKCIAQLERHALPRWVVMTYKMIWFYIYRVPILLKFWLILFAQSFSFISGGDILFGFDRILAFIVMDLGDRTNTYLLGLQKV